MEKLWGLERRLSIDAFTTTNKSLRAVQIAKLGTIFEISPPYFCVPAQVHAVLNELISSARSINCVSIHSYPYTLDDKQLVVPVEPSRRVTLCLVGTPTFERTMHGLTSLFKKKSTANALSNKVAQRSESTCNAGNSKQDSPTTTVARAQQTSGMTKSRKKFAAPSAPVPLPTPPPSDGSSLANESLETQATKEAPASKADDDVLEKNEKITEAIQNDLMKPNQILDDVENVLVREVIHYSPQDTVRSVHLLSLPSPIESDLPYVERKSNIVLNDSSGYKTIRVTQYDGTQRKFSERKAAPPLPSSLDQPLSSDLRNDTDCVTVTNSLDKSRSDRNVKETKTQSNMNGEELTADAYSNDVENAAEITQEYETLKKNFDLWQVLQARNRNSSEARQLHMELMRQHDSLMKKLQNVTEDIDSNDKEKTKYYKPLFLVSKRISNIAKPTDSPTKFNPA
ncbi:hypothetical protein KIN20_006256 [Parelaphostrongylus tenuis]|uniref:Uncharacterized protein n=1 Tax=Parelaphostrongylus tenuis TaxID=148309 RepID=A0AAD5M5S6_PARTN|nr:hypothetical protein KIN20_006256 [Parelaphostrongylus tenuis]